MGTFEEDQEDIRKFQVEASENSHKSINGRKYIKEDPRYSWGINSMPKDIPKEVTEMFTDPTKEDDLYFSEKEFAQLFPTCSSK